jgi:hypothetical protein
MSKKPQIKKGKNMLIEDVPEDIQQIIIKKQDEEKAICECERPQDYAIYKMLRAYNQLINDINIDNAVGLENGEIVLSLKVPISTPLGMALNYKRIGKK